MIISLVSMIFSFMLLVIFHEFGHFITAKLVGMRVDEFAIGFGPKLLGVQRGETIYSIRCIPLGGFNKIAGMDLEDVQDERSFNTKPIWTRITVFFAGSAMNFILAIILLTIVTFFIGKNVPVNEPVIGQIVPNKAADQVGLMAGDRIISINDIKIDDWQNLVSTIQMNSNKNLIIDFERAGNIQKINIIPEYDNNNKKGIIGISPIFHNYTIGFCEAISIGVTQSWDILLLIVSSIMEMFSGQISADVAGPIGIAKMTGDVAQKGFLPLLQLTAVLSLNIGLLNLLPIPVLDGGHIFILFLEGLRGKPFNLKFKQFSQYIGLLLLVILFIIAMYNDVLKFC